MVRYGDKDIRKLSPGKVTLAGRKQVFRRVDSNGLFAGDVIGTRDEAPGEAAPLLTRAMAEGRIIDRPRPLETIRARFARHFSRLDEKYKMLDETVAYPVKVSEKLAALQN
jgi:nicotinate phosphoribosyltransferase